MNRDEYNKLKAGARVKIVGDPITGDVYGRWSLGVEKGALGLVENTRLLSGNVLEVNMNLQGDTKEMLLVNPHCLEVVQEVFEVCRYNAVDGGEDGWSVVHTGTARKAAFFADNVRGARKLAEDICKALNKRNGEEASHE